MDLHLHTPASSDYQEPTATYLDVLQTAEGRGLDIIGFADHNTVAGYRRLRDEIAELELLERLNRLRDEEKSRLAEYRRLLGKILLLPGFEFTATFGFHIMGIFPPDTPVRDLEHLLLSLNIPRDQLDRGSATVGATTDVLTAYRLIHEAGGLAIAAHANSTNGVAMRGFGFGGQTKIAFTQDPHLHALEVTDLDQKGRRATAAFFNGSKPEYPRRMHCISGSDAHRLKRDPNNPKSPGIGDRACDVLLDEASFDALRALFEGKDFTRIRPHVAKGAPQEFDPVQQARDEGPNIVQAFHVSMLPRGGQQHAVLADVGAFANTNGGTIYIGVPRDPKHPPLGVENADRAAQDLRVLIERMLSPRLDVIVDTVESRGKKIIRAQVPRGDDLPYAIEDSKIFVREEAETSVAVRDELVQLVLQGRAPRGAEASAQVSLTGDIEVDKLLGGDAPPLHRESALPPDLVSPRKSTEAAPPELITTPSELPALLTDPTAEPTPPPRTGVEIASSEVRAGARYHTMRDLRNNSVVKNVTRASARRLWHYAITAKETGALKTAQINWVGDIGVWKKSTKGGVLRYDLVQRTPDGEVRVYYGVTEDGIHGPWKRLIENDKTPTVALPPEPVLTEVIEPPSDGPSIADLLSPDVTEATILAEEMADDLSFETLAVEEVIIPDLPTPPELVTEPEPPAKPKRTRKKAEKAESAAPDAKPKKTTRAKAATTKKAKPPAEKPAKTPKKTTPSAKPKTTRKKTTPPAE